jgi:hypothetical protein
MQFTYAHQRPRRSPLCSLGVRMTKEEFGELTGEGVACQTKDGWIAKFSVAWLPYEDWHPVAGAVANARLIVPLARAQAGYVLGSVVSFVLTR